MHSQHSTICQGCPKVKYNNICRSIDKTAAFPEFSLIRCARSIERTQHTRFHIRKFERVPFTKTARAIHSQREIWFAYDDERITNIFIFL